MKVSGRKVDPLNMTSTIFGLSFGGWALVLYNNFKDPSKTHNKIPNVQVCGARKVN